MKKIYSFLFLFVIFFGLVGCTAGNNNSEPKEDDEKQPTQLSEYDKLSDLEKGVFDAFILNVNNFYNPSEVRFLGFTTYSELGKSIYLNIQGSNKLGGTINKWYQLRVYDRTFVNNDGEEITFKKGEMNEAYINRTANPNSEVSFGKLNKALIEYWTDKGL